MKRYLINVIKSRIDGSYFWHLKGGNGQILAHSEYYRSLRNALKTARPIAKLLKARLTVVNTQPLDVV